MSRIGESTTGGLWLPGAGERGEWRVTAYGDGISFGGDENVLELDSGNGCVTLNILKITNCTL